MAEACSNPDDDLAGRRASLAAIWWLPAVALVGAVFLDPPLRTVIWTTALAWMGAACLLNAYRCRRVHCYFTGPFYLLAALATLFHGLDVLSLGPRGWEWIGFTLVAGSILLNTLPERVWGRYRESGEG